MAPVAPAVVMMMPRESGTFGSPAHSPSKFSRWVPVSSQFAQLVVTTSQYGRQAVHVGLVGGQHGERGHRRACRCGAGRW